jgi:rubrerythrin
MQFPMCPLSRAQILAFGSAAGLIGAPLLASFAAAAQSADPADIDSLNVAIALERAGIKAYADGAATGLLTPPVAALAARFVADHTAHRDALIGAVRAAGLEPTTATAPIAAPPLATERDVIAFALVVEEKAASTYLSVIPDLKNRALAGVAASILGVETTHVSALAGALGTRVYTSGFVA